MIPASDYDKKSKKDMKDEENLVRSTSEPEEALEWEEEETKGSNNAPNPIWLVNICVVCPKTDIGSKKSNRVYNRVNDAKASYPPMKNKKSGKVPVGNPKENIVS
jgi:hypothetical protein